MSWDKYHQTSFLSKNVLFRYIKNGISAVVHHNISLQTNTQHRTDLLQIGGLWNPLQPYAVQLYTAGFRLNCRCLLAVTCSIWTCSWLYNLPDFPLLFVIIFLTIPQQQVMAAGILQPGGNDAESSQTTGASNNAPPGQTQRQRR